MKTDDARSIEFTYAKGEFLRVTEERSQTGEAVGLWIMDRYSDIDLSPENARDLWPVLRRFAETGSIAEPSP